MLHNSANRFDVKLDPWSANISSGIPTCENIFTNSSVMVSALIVHRATASGYLVA